MKFNGLKVFHKKYGNGRIINVNSESILEVEFDNGKKMLVKYPTSFDCGLSFVDNDELNKEVNEILDKIKQAQEEKEREKRKLAELKPDLNLRTTRLDYGREISAFKDDFDFLSNTYDSDVLYNGITYKNNLSAFFAQKSLDEDIRKKFINATANQAKCRARKIEVRKDWDTVQDKTMYEIVKAKFSQNEELKNKLLQTENVLIINGNTSNEKYWGMCRGNGRNILGKILMKVREDLLYSDQFYK